MPRHDVKAYTTLLARVPQELADEAKRYATQHRCSVSELIRDGLEMRLESGDVPGRTTGEPGEEVLHEVLHGITEVLHTLKALSPAVRQTMSDVLHEVLPRYLPRSQEHQGGMTEVLPHDATTARDDEQGMTEVLHDKADTGSPSSAGFDATRFALGKLCVSGHAYQDTGETLYRLPKYVCPQCDAARARERRARQKAVQEG